MNPNAASLNAFVCGAVAAATLCAEPSHAPAKPHGEGALDGELRTEPAPARTPPRGWRRGLGALVDMVSGPTPVRA